MVERKEQSNNLPKDEKKQPSKQGKKEREKFSSGQTSKNPQKELALKILESAHYEALSPRERAAVRRLAEVGVPEPVEETPLAVLSQMSEIYAREIRELKTRYYPQIEKKFSQGTPFGVIFDLKETASQDEIVAATFHTLINGIYNRHFSQEEINNLKKNLLFLSTTGNEDLYAGVSGFTMAVVNLIDYWRNDFTGKEGAKVTTEGATSGALEKVNNHIEFLLRDPRICLALHDASTQGLGDVRFKKGIVIEEKNKEELGKSLREQGERYSYTKDISLGRKEEVEREKKLMAKILREKDPQKNKFIAREMAEVAYDILGDMLHQITLKVRADPLQAGAYVYSVYKTDQLGWQYWGGKYRAVNFDRLIHQEKIGYRSQTYEPVLLWGNGMHTLFTLAVHGELVRKWLELLDKSDTKDTEINIGLRNKAALISWWGEYDFRLPGVDALDFEEFLACKTREEQEKMYKHFKKIFDRYSAEQKLRIIRGNLARARTIRELKETTKGKKEWRYTLEPIIDLDAVWRNPKSGKWEYCIDFRWFIDEIKNRVDMLWVYEGYKQKTAELLVRTIKGGSERDYQERFGALDALLSEDSFKEHYATPEYRGWVASHLIERTLYEELEPVIHQDRYAGRRVEFLETARRFATWLEFHLNQELHFNAANIEGNWRTAFEIQTALEQRERAEELFRAGKIKEEDVAKIGIPAGKRLRQVIMENSCVGVWETFAKKYGLTLEELLTFAGLKETGRRKVKVKIGNRESGFEDKIYEYLILDYLNLKEVEISQEEEIPDWVKQTYQTEKVSENGKTIWKIKVLDRVNDDPHIQGTEWHRKMNELISRKKDKEDNVFKLSRDLAIPETNDWRLLTPLHLLRLTRKLIHQYDKETEYFDEKGRRKKGNWYDSGQGIWMLDFYKKTQRINAITRETIIPLGRYRGQRLWRAWDAEKEKPLEEKRGISSVRNLYGGWWEFAPETGLSEAFPFYLEEDLVTFLVGRYTTPYRKHVAYRVSDAEYAKIVRKPVEEIGDKDRSTSKYKEILNKNLKRQYHIAMGPDGWENVFTILQVIGTATEPGKALVDHEPAGEYMRLTGCDTPSTVNQYRKYAIDTLNITPIPTPGSPEQIKARQEEIAKELSERIKNLEMIIAAPGQLLEFATAAIGMEWRELVSGKGIKADNLYQWGYSLLSGAIVGRLSWLWFIHYPDFAPALASLLFGTPTALLFGAEIGTDIDENSLRDFYLFRIPLVGIKVKLPFLKPEHIVRMQNSWLPSVRRKRIKVQKNLQFPECWLKPGYLVELIKFMQDKFGIAHTPGEK